MLVSATRLVRHRRAGRRDDDAAGGAGRQGEGRNREGGGNESQPWQECQEPVRGGGGPEGRGVEGLRFSLQPRHAGQREYRQLRPPSSLAVLGAAVHDAFITAGGECVLKEAD